MASKRPEETAKRDAYFEKVWREQNGIPGKVAAALQISYTAMAARRRDVQRRLGRMLPTTDLQGRACYDTSKMLVTHNKTIIKLGIQNGTVIVGSDAHIWPGELTTMQRAFVNFCRELKPKAVIANGDFFDGARISRWPSIGWEEKPTVQQEIEAVQSFMTAVQKAAKGARRIWPAGNHDLRFETRIAVQAPEYAKVNGVHLKDHFPEWEPCWRCDINEDVIVRHRENGGEHADWNNVLKGGKTIITGHDHRTGVVPYRNYNGVRYGVRCGFMGDSPLDPQYVNYLEAREPNWHPAFVVLTFADGRLLYPELVTKVTDDTVCFRGRSVTV